MQKCKLTLTKIQNKESFSFLYLTIYKKVRSRNHAPKNAVSLLLRHSSHRSRILQTKPTFLPNVNLEQNIKLCRTIIISHFRKHFKYLEEIKKRNFKFWHRGVCLSPYKSASLRSVEPSTRHEKKNEKINPKPSDAELCTEPLAQPSALTLGYFCFEKLVFILRLFSFCYHRIGSRKLFQPFI